MLANSLFIVVMYDPTGLRTKGGGKVCCFRILTIFKDVLTSAGTYSEPALACRSIPIAEVCMWTGCYYKNITYP
jgi:hypothetical protein